MIGRKFNDEILQGDIKNWPFKVVSKEGKPAIQVEVKGEKKIFVPEEVKLFFVFTIKSFFFSLFFFLFSISNF